MPEVKRLARVMARRTWHIKLLFMYRAQIIRNRLRRAVWGILTPHDFDAEILRQALLFEERLPFKEAKGYTVPAGIRDVLTDDLAVPEWSYVVDFRSCCVIDPSSGFAISHPFYLVEASLDFGDWTRRPNLLHLIRVPSVIGYFVARLARRGRLKKVDRAISLRFPWETNYFHALNDIFGKLALLERLDIDPSVPVVVGKPLYNQHFFQRMLKNGMLAGRSVIVQDDSYLECRSLIFCKAPTHSRATFDYVLDKLLGHEDRPEGDRRIFLTRAPHRGRGIANEADVREVCAALGFEVIDTDGMSLDQQAELFSGARYVAGVHGAGLTNIIFARGHRLGVLEIFPPGERLLSFAWLAYQYGFDYDALLTPVDRHRLARSEPFAVDAALLREKLERLVTMGTKQGELGSKQLSEPNGQAR